MTEFVEVKTAELKGAALDWMVAEATGQAKTILRGKAYALFGSLALPFNDPEKGYAPSSCWHCGGPLLEGQRISVVNEYQFNTSPTACVEIEVGDCWHMSGSYTGDTYLIAVCRAIVGAKFGETVSVPKELLPC